MTRRGVWLLLLWVAAGTAGLLAQEHRADVIKLSIHDTVQPVTAEYLDRGLRHAAEVHAQLVIVSLGTPGGLLTSTRTMVQSIERSPVPVAVFISPAGSRAGSAGFFLLEAADVAAMAPGTNAGAAHPVLEGGKADPVLNTKMENDAAAFLRATVTRRGRNVAAAEDAVRASRSYSAEEALQAKLIDLISADDASLLQALGGHSYRRFDGSQVTFHTIGAVISLLPPSHRERLLTYLANPDLAVILLVLGGLLIYLEMNIPGTIVPGALGTLLLLLGIFGLNLLPIRHTSLLLLGAAVVMLLLELKFASHGILATAGILCLVGGLGTLVDAPGSGLEVHLATAVAAGVGFGTISAALAWAALRAKRSKQLLGPHAMIGLVATARTPLSPSGQVEVRGELWQARTADGAEAARGDEVRVEDLDGLTLLVGRIQRGESYRR